MAACTAARLASSRMASRAPKNESRCRGVADSRAAFIIGACDEQWATTISAISPLPWPAPCPSKLNTRAIHSHQPLSVQCGWANRCTPPPTSGLACPAGP